jgi:hypothetical protein
MYQVSSIDLHKIIPESVRRIKIHVKVKLGPQAKDLLEISKF